jgi:flagellar basal-body rod protein FlgG
VVNFIRGIGILIAAYVGGYNSQGSATVSGMIYKTGAGAILQQMRLDVYANNLANVNTAGFKADLPVFLIDTEEKVPANEIHTPARLSPYSQPLACETNFDAGAMQKTGGRLDVAIVGRGFFEIQTPQGLQYTRNGQFSINQRRELSTPDGWPVMGQGGVITLDGNRVEISDDGQVMVDGDVAGVLQIVDFVDPRYLHKSGNTMFKAENPSAGRIEAQDYRIAQGALESSNVDPIRTMTEIIESMRVFETYQKVIRAADDATGKTVNEVGRNA